MTDLGHVPGDNRTWPTDINDRGYIVGGTAYQSPSGGVLQNRRSRAFVLSPFTHQFRILPAWQDQAATATAINVHGVIVGTSKGPGQADEALIWNACGKSDAVLVQDFYGTGAFGINRYEHVVGAIFETGTFWRRNDGPCQSTD